MIAREGIFEEGRLQRRQIETRGEGLRLAGTALGGWMLARSALVAQGKLATRDGDPAFLEAKLITARFYAEVILPPALAQLGPLKAAGRTVFALTEDQF